MNNMLCINNKDKIIKEFESVVVVKKYSALYEHVIGFYD